jgi:hypothetical protein
VQPAISDHPYESNSFRKHGQPVGICRHILGRDLICFGQTTEDVNAFVATAIKEMAKTHGKPKEKIASGKTHDGHDYFINEYPATKTHSQSERVAYV